jgi:hypothetical protein
MRKNLVVLAITAGAFFAFGRWADGPHFHPIAGAPHRAAPMFDIDNISWGSVNKTRIDVREQFGLPHGVDAVLLLVSVRDAHSFDHDCFVSAGILEVNASVYWRQPGRALPRRGQPPPSLARRQMGRPQPMAHPPPRVGSTSRAPPSGH